MRNVFETYMKRRWPLTSLEFNGVSQQYYDLRAECAWETFQAAIAKIDGVQEYRLAPLVPSDAIAVNNVREEFENRLNQKVVDGITLRDIISKYLDFPTQAAYIGFVQRQSEIDALIIKNAELEKKVLKHETLDSAVTPTPPAQEAEPVVCVESVRGDLAICRFRGMNEVNPGDLLYTRPANDELRKAAEEALRIAEGRNYDGNKVDMVRKVLRTALEKKS